MGEGLNSGLHRNDGPKERTQSLGLTPTPVPGLSVGVTVRRVAFREWVTGLVIGALIAVVLYPAIFVLWGNAHVALSVAIAVFAACAIATLVAMGLPWIFSLAKVDPAYGSGPLATVFQDILSILVYLLVTVAIVGT